MHWSKIEPAQEKRLAVLGDPPDSDLIRGAASAAVQAMGLPVEVLQVQCGPDEFVACVEGLRAAGFVGATIGNPFKPEAAKLATKFYVARHGLGVANVLKFGATISAQNTEVPAFTKFVHDLKPAMALVMGSGRAARSAVIGLFDLGWRVKVWNRNVIRSKPFVVAFEPYGKVELASQPDPAGCSLIVNATPLGAKAGEQPPVKWTSVGPRSLAVDFVYRSVATEFLRGAMQRGLKTVDGRQLLVEQAALALEWLLGQDVPREPMYAAVGFRISTDS